ncbi:hypothetical protein [Pseudomarimonas arenosa]|uniref:Uncharacterized protein n=1 Tax=Pseudomarimonas arenosa TaxID=2774145 RepID=A0AAW3ZEN6_9GAMM|nr:hypothetical protein [Pseudomarimonas arenosa]MBD8524598.1 hypothetical protein [Pseudomarimonas arenosa]
MNTPSLMLAALLAIATPIAQAEPPAAPPPFGRPPLIEQVLAELRIDDQQRAQVRALLERWRTEADQEHSARRVRHRQELSAILNDDQVVAVLAALPPPPHGSSRPTAPAQ